MTADWPVQLRGVTESIVATRGPNDRWNLAALGLHAPADADGQVTARTWGETRTRQNFAERGRGYVQFTRDPVDFVEAALAVREADEPVLASADAHVEVVVDRIDAGTSEGTEWREWALEPVAVSVERRVVPTTNRGHGAVIEGTVAASRLDVRAYDTDRLLERLAFLEGVVARCGGPEEAAAWERLRELAGADWPTAAGRE